MGELLQLIMGLAANSQAGSLDLQKQHQLQDLLDRIQNIKEPDLKDVDPSTLGPSDAGKVTADPAMVAAQKAALAKLQQVGQEGFTIEDRSALEDALSRTARQEAAGRNAIANDMQARGQLGSGAQLAMALQNQQAAGDRSHQEGMQVAAEARKRAYQAMLGQGQLAGQMREQGFGEDMSAAKARDEISRYNAAALERAKMYNAQNPQRRFDNSLRKAVAGVAPGAAVAGGLGAEAQGARNQGAALGVFANNAVTAATRGSGGGGQPGSSPGTSGGLGTYDSQHPYVVQTAPGDGNEADPYFETDDKDY